MFSTRWMVTLLVGFFLIAGCGGGNNPAAPPDGWETSDLRWWKAGVDTSEVFVNLDSLSTMGVVDQTMQLGGGDVTQDQFNVAIKQSLIRLYRNNPVVVDSLFEEHAAPLLEEVNRSGVVGKEGQLKSKIRDKNQKKAYEAIAKHFREPQRQSAPDIVWPDSLRSEEHSGVVQVQAHLAIEGEGSDAVARPDAVQVLSGTNPTLDRIALRATTGATWDPAYITEDGEQTPVESWVRFDIPFQTR